MRGRDVPDVTSRVEAVLTRAGRSPGGARGVLYVTPDHTLRWDIGPIAAQQTRFNHVTLDLIENLRSENEWRRAEVEALPGEGSTGRPEAWE